MNPPLAEILETGQKIQLSADVRDALGKQVTNARVTWQALDPSVATVDHAGTVTGMSEGVAEIRGTYAGVSATSVVSVSRPKNKGSSDGSTTGGSSVTLYPDSDTIPLVGGSVKLLAIARNPAGKLFGANKLSWTSEDQTVATVDGDGVVTGRNSGLAKIVAGFEGAADTSEVWVAPSNVAAGMQVSPKADTIPTLGGTVTLTGRVLDGSGLAIAGLDVGWTSLDPSIATVKMGVVQGVKKGVVKIVGFHKTFADTATIWVAPVMPATSLYITPKTDTIPAIGGTVTLTATLLDGSGGTLSQPVTWGTLDPLNASVTQTGVVKGAKAGVARITASYNSLVDTATVWIAPAPPKPAYVVTLSPASDSVEVEKAVNLKAVVRDSSGAEVETAHSTWASLDADVATVSEAGPVDSVDVKGVKAGSARIVAQYGGAADTAVVMVKSTGSGGGTGAYTVKFTPETAYIANAGDVARITWDVYDSSGHEIAKVYPTWTSLDPTVATVPAGPSRAADITGVSQGTAQIVAEWNGTVDTATVVVDSGTGSGGVSGPTVAVSPGWAVVQVGSTTVLSVQAKDSLGNTVATPQVSWQSLDASMASVSSTGVVTGLSVGSARIRVSWSSVADTAIVSVNQPLPTGGSSLTPGNMVPSAGPLVARMSASNTTVNAYDGRYATAEQATYDTWVAGGQSGADGSSHYGALRSRYQWSIRNGLPVGPSAPSNSPYKHGVAMTRAFLNKYAQPNQFKIAPHNNTAMLDVEMLYVLEGDAVALAHLKGIALFYGRDYLEYYFDLTGPNSDPRSSAILLQTLNVAHRLGLPFTAARWGTTWAEAAEHMVGRMAAQIPASGKVVSLAHKNTNQGDEAFFMNAMLATELLRWHGFATPQPAWVSLAQRIVDHLIDEQNRRGAACLPYTSNKSGCASDLAGYYVWPALVLWQETGDPKYQDFALQNLVAARTAYIVQTKIFNQIYSTGAQAAEALMLGVSWH